ncbi:MAG: carboxypeptidase regulatory-like domain-containing protein, partial [Actinomycetales bacterium]|nr:carboxypeptidase regulatory-like domain-containing protein [Actinomycetales bacterium]
ALVEGSVVPPVGVDPSSLAVDVYEVSLAGMGDDQVIADWTPVGSEPVAVNGAFHLRNLEPGHHYSVAATAPGVVSLYLGGAYELSDASWFTVSDGAVILDFSGTGGAEVLVTDDDGAPAPNAEVELFRWIDGDWDSTGSLVFTDSSGTAVVRGLPPGVYTAHVQSDGTYPQYLGGALALPGAPAEPLDAERMFAVAAGAITAVPAALVATISMSGHAEIPSGVRHDDVSILLHRVAGAGQDAQCTAVRTVFPDASGSYTVDGLVPGETYTLQFGGIGLPSQFLGGATWCEDAETFVAVPGAVILDHVVATGVTVSGQVRDVSTGDPVLDAVELELLRWDATGEFWDVSASQVTDAGTYSFAEVAPGTYTLLAFASNGRYDQYLGAQSVEPEPSDSVATFAVASDGDVAIDLELEPYRTLTGRVTGVQDPTALFLELVEGEFDGEALSNWHESGAAATPAGDGDFALAGMIPGRRYAVRVSGPGFDPMFVGPSGPVTEGAAGQWWWGDIDADAGVVDLASLIEPEPEP